MPTTAALKRLAGLPGAAWGMALAHAGLGIVLIGIVGVTAWREERIMITPRHSGATADYHELAWPTIEKNVACFLEGRTGDMVNVVPR